MSVREYTSLHGLVLMAAGVRAAVEIIQLPLLSVSLTQIGPMAELMSFLAASFRAGLSQLSMPMTL